MKHAWPLLALLAVSTPALGVNGFEYGDVIVSGVNQDPDGSSVSRILIYGRGGSFKRELIRRPGFWSEPLYQDGIVYIGNRPSEIGRIDGDGNWLAPFATLVSNVNFLSPGPGAGVLAVNGSGEIFQYSADGTLLHHRDITAFPLGSGGIDLARDDCTVYYATLGSLARWNACLDTPGELFGPNLAAGSSGMRLLDDGTFMIAVIGLFPGTGNNRVIHVDSQGNLIRSYPIPGFSLALDIDGTSFWTSVGNALVHADIETGGILSLANTGSNIRGISVVGEPRAGLAAATITAVSPQALALLAVALTIVSLFRLRAV